MREERDELRFIVLMTGVYRVIFSESPGVLSHKFPPLDTLFHPPLPLALSSFRTEFMH